MALIGETTGRPQGERVPMNVDQDVREKVRGLLFEPEMRGVGYSEFLQRAVDAAWKELGAARALAEETADAHMAGLYGSQWVLCCAWLLDRYDYETADLILRSKHMRWARDAHSADDSAGTLEALVRYAETDLRDSDVAELKAQAV